MARRNRSSYGGFLPLYLRACDGGKRSFSNSWIHLIPVTVVLCFFILWFFSYAVELEVTDGRITDVPKIEEEPITDVPKMEKPISLSETRVDIAFLLTAAAPPYASALSMQAGKAPTASEPPTGTD